jgi:hypothetical protein
MSAAKQRLAITVLIILGILFVGFFGMRAARAARHIRDSGYEPGKQPPHPSETDVEFIRDWMTIPYIARTFGVPDRILFKELQIPNEGNREKSLKELNDEYFPDQAGFVLKKVKEVVAEHRPPAPPTAPVP